MILLAPYPWPARLSSGIEADTREWEQILLILHKGSLLHRCVMGDTLGTGELHSGLETPTEHEQTGTQGMRTAPLYTLLRDSFTGSHGAALPP